MHLSAFSLRMKLIFRIFKTVANPIHRLNPLMTITGFCRFGNLAAQVFDMTVNYPICNIKTVRVNMVQQLGTGINLPDML